MRVVVITNDFNLRGRSVSPYFWNGLVLKRLLERWCGRDKVLFVRNNLVDVVGMRLLRSREDFMIVTIFSTLSARIPFRLLRELGRQAKRVVCVLNDYAGWRELLRLFVKEGSVESEKIDFVISVERSVMDGWKGGIGGYYFVNLNVFKYNDWDGKFYGESFGNRGRRGLIYYGSYRQGRRKFFQKYFKDGRVDVSTSVKNFERFREFGKVNLIEPFEWEGGKLCKELFLYKSSLYIEDVFSHKVFCCMANRFYECMVHKVPMFFDVSCRGTVEKAGYGGIIGDFWFVDSLDEIYDKLGSEGFEREKERLFSERLVEKIKKDNREGMKMFVEAWKDIMRKVGVGNVACKV